MNPLYREYGQRQNNVAQMIGQFNRFRQNYRGDPRAEVQNLLNSGRMSQSQYNDLQQKATQFMQILNTIPRGR